MTYIPVLSPADELLLTAVAHIDEMYHPSRDWTDNVSRSRLDACAQYENGGLTWRPEWFVTADRFAAVRALDALESRGLIVTCSDCKCARRFRLSAAAYSRGRRLGDQPTLEDDAVRDLYQSLRWCRVTDQAYQQDPGWTPECRLCGQADWSWAGMLDDLRALEQLMLPLIVHGYVEWRRSTGRRLYYRARDRALDPAELDWDSGGTTGAKTLYWSARQFVRATLRARQSECPNQKALGLTDLPHDCNMVW